jgi:hypothetical protein
MKINTHHIRPADHFVGQRREIFIDNLIGAYQELNYPIPLHILVEAIDEHGFIIQPYNNLED